jgi:hypothetical protein
MEIKGVNGEMLKMITSTEYKSMKKDLIHNLKVMKKAYEATLKGDGKRALFYSSKQEFRTLKSFWEDISMKQMQDIIKELSQTFCNEDGKTKSTALFPRFNRNWTIGSFGSIFVDIKVPHEFSFQPDIELRVSLKLGDSSGKAIFFIEPHYPNDNGLAPIK